MVKRGRLNNIEKMAIQGFLDNGVDTETIAGELDRSQAAVDKYVDGELADIKQTIQDAGGEIESVAEPKPKKKATRYEKIREKDIAQVKPREQDEIDIETVGSREIFEAVHRRLRSAGLTDKDATQIVNSAIEYAWDQGITYHKEDIFYTACIKRMRAGNFMIKKSEGGREGVAIMTQASSTRTDEARKNVRGATKRTRGNIYNPRTGEYS